MFQDITVEEWLQQKHHKSMTLIDVRSPSEFREYTIPGSVNIPVFDDEERAEIGTLYKQVSVEAAKDRGLEIMSAKLPSFIRQFRELEGDKAVFCWRGGMRSRTAATVLSLMDVHVKRIQGGIKAYRKLVVDTLGSISLDTEAIVLHGFTGTGKTEVLQQLQAEGYPVLDLEGLSGHRGSIFGHIGLPSYNQKMFDAQLFERLQELSASPYIIMEAESKRIGKVILPDFLMNKKAAGSAIVLQLPLEQRVAQIMKDYRPEEYKEQCIQAFLRIKDRIHTPIAAEIHKSLEEDRFADAVRLLLLHYYDPRYDHTSQMYGEGSKLELQADSAEDAAARLKEILAARFQQHTS
ncbi:tRNA 2-selenouridine(34) synthase MnmH [Paenibacillus sp. F411]|uniref:tRNA 2-selenouridine(34) synthase MnmH n=1 Tax=Paenibacillus sp. F411 TaxID=2820239 RepID=UPI001AAEF874|nr:tRNA 2-selenouridine(34) synthase MnmH [Paenibacillus sp. F411]MBO2942713.1 tRNA 2-selenouridine(34) synthase MnmH [Paenibacillus sp. F411]